MHISSKKHHVCKLLQVYTGYVNAFFLPVIMIRKTYILAAVTLLFFSTGCSQAPEGGTQTRQRHEVLLEMSKDYNKVLLLGLVASITASFVLFYKLSQKHKKEKVLEAYTAETRISRKVHDEIANEIYSTILFVASEEVVSGTKKDKLISQLDDIYLRTRNISRENHDIDTGFRFPIQLKLMLGCYAGDSVNVLIKGLEKVEWDKITASKKIATYRVLQELMVNMAKHSHATVVLVDFKEEKKKINITYSDNGTGTAGEKIIFKNGLQNVENRMVAIGGSIIFDFSAGRGFHLTLIYPANTIYV